MRKGLSFVLVLALSAGVLGAALTSASASSLDPVMTSADSFRFARGNLSGRFSADRRLCLNHASVNVFKVVGGERHKLFSDDLSTANWSETGQAAWTHRHPAMNIDRRLARLRALRGNYIVVLPPASVAEYGKTFTCLGSVKHLTIDI